MAVERTGLVSKSLKAWLREARQVKGYSWFDLLHGYIYGRWPYFYIGVGTGQHPLARLIAPLASRLIDLFARSEAGGPVPSQGETFANTYHGKVVPLAAARQLVMVKEEIQASLPETVIPYDRARELILKHPDHIVALDCPCRVARKDPCLPLDVCLIVGEPFASFITEHQPARSRWITSQEADEILLAEDKRGHVHHAFFKDAMLGRFYAICNCCDCCCGAMRAHHSGVPMLASSGFIARVDDSLCKGCRKCEKACPFKAVEMVRLEEDDKHLTARIDAGRCMGCGVCVNQCARQAITLERDPGKGEPLEIFRLLDQASGTGAG